MPLPRFMSNLERGVSAVRASRQSAARLWEQTLWSAAASCVVAVTYESFEPSSSSHHHFSSLIISTSFGAPSNPFSSPCRNSTHTLVPGLDWTDGKGEV